MVNELVKDDASSVAKLQEIFNASIVLKVGARGSVVVKPLCYKPEGRGIAFR
jgi:hypothetical protein